MEIDDMLLKDKVAVITGGAGLNGLGFATARLMASHGARVVVLDLARAEPTAAAGACYRHDAMTRQRDLKPARPQGCSPATFRRPPVRPTIMA